MLQFTGGELVEVAINIERAGIAFYSALVERAQNEALKDTYRDLVRMEVEHRETFEEMLETVGRYQPFEADIEEHAMYLRALAESAVFTDEKMAAARARNAATEADAVLIAIGAEKDSILFYSAMRNITRERERAMIDRIIEEEKLHLRQLTDIKGQLTAG